MRHRAKEARASGSTEVKDQLENVPVESLADRVDQELEADLLAEAMRRVEPRVGAENWEIFRLLTFEERPAAEVAALVGKKIAAVWKIRSRVKAMIQNEIQELGWSGADAEEA